MAYDLLLTGGRVLDPAGGRDAVLDVAVSGGRIAAVAAGLPRDGAREVVDVSGRLVTPAWSTCTRTSTPARPTGESTPTPPPGAPASPPGSTPVRRAPTACPRCARRCGGTPYACRCCSTSRPSA
ncbi:hypothetical protein ACFQY4_41365 [Catellatospora bangladeshensis]|uniref:hypothetical protein n=1 Tax=Catellatospora bangladeshensis TaxID=310355 RepID=UPI0036111AD9